MIDLTTKTENDHRLTTLATLVAENIRKEMPATLWSTVRVMTLGHGASVYFSISLDARETWNNGIFENSRHARFSWDAATGKLEMFQVRDRQAKFRKCSIKPDGNQGKEIASRVAAFAETYNALVPAGR